MLDFEVERHCGVSRRAAAFFELEKRGRDQDDRFPRLAGFQHAQARSAKCGVKGLGKILRRRPVPAQRAGLLQGAAITGRISIA
ncbi:MAG: hypothetical protein C0409_04700 [Novosphingobium sp.]|nr:hypothetical protein [Novosphingobium sp.]